MVMDGTLNPKQNCPFHFISLIGRYVYLELFKKFEWSKVASLALDGHKYSEYISHLQDVLQQNDVTFIANRKFPVESPDMSMVSYPMRLISGCVNCTQPRAHICTSQWVPRCPD